MFLAWKQLWYLLLLTTLTSWLEVDANELSVNFLFANRNDGLRPQDGWGAFQLHCPTQVYKRIYNIVCPSSDRDKSSLFSVEARPDTSEMYFERLSESDDQTDVKTVSSLCLQSDANEFFPLTCDDGETCRDVVTPECNDEDTLSIQKLDGSQKVLIVYGGSKSMGLCYVQCVSIKKLKAGETTTTTKHPLTSLNFTTTTIFTASRNFTNRPIRNSSTPRIETFSSFPDPITKFTITTTMTTMAPGEASDAKTRSDGGGDKGLSSLSIGFIVGGVIVVAVIIIGFIVWKMRCQQKIEKHRASSGPLVGGSLSGFDTIHKNHYQSERNITISRNVPQDLSGAQAVPTAPVYESVSDYNNDQDTNINDLTSHMTDRKRTTYTNENIPLSGTVSEHQANLSDGECKKIVSNDNHMGDIDDKSDHVYTSVQDNYVDLPLTDGVLLHPKEDPKSRPPLPIPSELSGRPIQHLTEYTLASPIGDEAVTQRPRDSVSQSGNRLQELVQSKDSNSCDGQEQGQYDSHDPLGMSSLGTYFELEKEESMLKMLRGRYPTLF